MKRAGVLIISCGLVLAGCTTTTEVRRTVAAPSNAPATSAAAPSTTASSPAAVPSPDEQQRVALVTKLQLIDPGLVADVDRAVSRAQATCERILQPSDGTTTLNEYVQQEFEGGNVPDVTPEQADAIVAAVQAAFCA